MSASVISYLDLLTVYAKTTNIRIFFFVAHLVFVLGFLFLDIVPVLRLKTGFNNEAETLHLKIQFESP